MKQTDWKQVEAAVRGLFPHVLQIAVYDKNKWLLVFEDEPENYLHSLHPLTKVIHKHRLTTPLIVSRKFINTSLDSYPLEFLDIQSNYSNLYAAEDLVANLKFDKADIRCQVERELKSKWLLTRLLALHLMHRHKHMFNLLRESYASLLPVFKGFCYLNGSPIPKEEDKLLDSLQEILHSDVKILRYVASHRKASSSGLVVNLFHDYLRMLNICSDKIDGWQVA